jgi:Fic family protein
LLSEQFDIFLQKLNHIKNPFEQSLFILVFIPYFQIFMDINKRTSRISANIPLLKNGLVPFSFLQMKDRDYINAILAIYELNDVSLMRDIFVSNYLLNMRRYL